MYNDDIIVIRGGGDIATGIAQKFFRAGMRVVLLESKDPTAIRRGVSLCTAVTDGESQVEGMTARLVSSPSQCPDVFANGGIPIMVDELGASIDKLRPNCVIDAILAKRNLGTTLNMAPVVIGVGPGFTAGVDVHAVIETMRGHNLGRVILEGSAKPNTGIPGEIGGKSAIRVLRSPHAGVIRCVRDIGEVVNEGETVFYVDESAVAAPFTGVIRGLIREGMSVPANMKCGDIDPRVDSDCFTISDKARCVGGGALEAYLYLRRTAK